MITKTENEVIQALLHKVELQRKLVRTLLADMVVLRDPTAPAASLLLTEVAGSA